MTRLKIGSIVFIYLMPVVLIWILVGQILQSQLTIDKLVKVTGIIDAASEVTTYQHSKTGSGKTVELRIFLKDTSEYFRIMSIYKYDRFQNQIQSGDTAEIYIRPKWMIPFGMGYRNDVFQMSINGQIIFPISDTKKNEDEMIIFSLLAIPSCILLGKWIRKKAKQKTN
jgi:hypothetical protein